MTRIDLVYFDAGGGHRSAANALSKAIEMQGRPWQVRLVNLQEVLDPLDVFRKVTGIRLEDIYNLLLKRGWTLGSGLLLKGMHLMIRLYHGKQVALLRRFWKEDPADLVVSVVPNFNRALCESLDGRRFVTILTDIADFPPHFWIERQKQWVICGSEKAVEQARALGHSDERIHRVSGMILNPRFYEEVEPMPLPGFDPAMPTGLVMFGGEGSAAMLEIARRLEPLPVQLILICGRNQRLAERLRALPHRHPMLVEGFTREVPRYMRAASFLVGKPGPGSLSEALAMHLPVIVERSRWTLPQERYNPDWILEKGVGLVVPSFRRIDKAVQELLQPGNYQRMQANAAALENRAVFEIPAILESILAR